jgi:superfamily II DNA or RNA helicase
MIEIKYIGNNKQQAQLFCENDVLSSIREYFSVSNPAYRRNQRFSQSRLYAITPSGKFDVGLLDEIKIYFEANQLNFKIEEDLYKNYYNGFDDPKLVKFTLMDYREHQEKSITNGLKKGKGIVLIPTAGGKTYAIAGLIESIRLNLNNSDAKALVLVPSLQLVEQTYKDFEEYGLKSLTKWSGDNKPNFESKTIIAGNQILLSDKTDLSILSDIDILLVDECHVLRKNNEINKILKFINTNFKYGFTGTLPTDKIDQWNIFGKLGPIIYQERTEDLKNKKYVSNFRILILKLKHSNIPKFSVNLNKPAEAYQQELDFLLQNQRRNEIICKLANKLNQNTLIMVDRIEHGDILEKLLKQICDESRPIYFIRGLTEMEERERIRSLMDKRNDVIVVAISKIFSTGINIPNLHNIIFASAGKAKIKIMQSIGRALRLHPTKTIATIFDVADNTKYGKIHIEERKKLYNSENFNYEEKNIQT